MQPAKACFDHWPAAGSKLAPTLATPLPPPSFHTDSIKDVAVNTTLKLMHFLNVTHVPLAVSTLKTQNAFPLMYRAGPLAADVLPALNPPDLNLPALRDKLVSKQAGQDALTELLLKQKEPVTVVATGACAFTADSTRHTHRATGQNASLTTDGTCCCNNVCLCPLDPIHNRTAVGSVPLTHTAFW